MEKISNKLYSWASILEPGTRAQAELASTMPFIWPHYALMPDAHLGKGATVGSVIPTLGAIMPAAVGVDIGCGMIAVRTQYTKADLVATGHPLSVIRNAIEEKVPVSAGGYNTVVRPGASARIEELDDMPGAGQAYDVAPKWPLQLGTLGSGNHFIEISLDELDRVWLFLHSGSRGVGNKLAMRHIKIAQAQCKNVDLPHPDLAYLTEGTEEFSDYIRDLRWAQHFALLNREEMMMRVSIAVSNYMDEQVHFLQRIQCHHNYTEIMPAWLRETFGGLSLMAVANLVDNVWLSRKGAIDASYGKLGLIPGSMGAASYVVEGRGNMMSLWSAPHGAGRNYSRNAAKRQFSMADLEDRMTANGTEWRHTDAFLDEHPLAYKDIGVVMNDARDLVTPLHALRAIVNVKGD